MKQEGPYPTYFTQIQVRGQLDPRWQEWFDPLTITYDAKADITILAGELPDQSALMGILNKLNQINLSFITISQISSVEQS
jgi:hypothetical protein